MPIAKELEKTIMQCLQKDPQYRMPNVGELIRQLKQ
jgi:hypothetical protein